MKNMQMTAEESKEYGAIPTESSAPKYPYGLQLRLNDDSLEKLGITKLPEVGQVMQVTALATVVSVSMNQQQEGEAENRAELQITDMEVTKATGDLAKKMYPDMG